MVGARDRNLADLERLAQRIERLRLELGQFVEEQHAVMRERDFARPRAQPAADQRRHAGGMVRARNGRRLVSAPPSISPATDAIMETSSSSAGVSGGRMVGSRAASIDLPAPGGPTMSRLWPPAAATSSARLALSWPLMSLRSTSALAASRIFGCGRASTWVPRKWLASWMSDARGDDLHLRARPGGFGAAGGGADQAFAAGIGADGGRQHARDRGDRAVEAEFAQHREARRARRGGIAPIAAIRPSAIGRS